MYLIAGIITNSVWMESGATMKVSQWWSHLKQACVKIEEMLIKILFSEISYFFPQNAKQKFEFNADNWQEIQKHGHSNEKK